MLVDSRTPLKKKKKTCLQTLGEHRMKHLRTMMYTLKLVPRVSLPGVRQATLPDQAGLSLLQLAIKRNTLERGYLANLLSMYLQAV